MIATGSGRLFTHTVEDALNAARAHANSLWIGLAYLSHGGREPSTRQKPAMSGRPGAILRSTGKPRPDHS